MGLTNPENAALVTSQWMYGSNRKDYDAARGRGSVPAQYLNCLYSARRREINLQQWFSSGHPAGFDYTCMAVMVQVTDHHADDRCLPVPSAAAAVFKEVGRVE